MKQVEEVLTVMTAIFKCMGCRCCLNFLRKRAPRTRTVHIDSLYVKTAILRGDEIRSIISEAQDIKSELDIIVLQCYMQCYHI